MMAASLGFTGASTDHSGDTSSAQEAAQSLNDVAEDEFGSFTAAEQLSDPFGDVYGADADFGEFLGGLSGQEQTSASSSALKNVSLMSFSPLKAPATTTVPPTLLPSISGEMDPFAGIVDGTETLVGNATDKEKTAGNVAAFERALVREMFATAPTSTSSATSAILGSVWGNASQEIDGNPLSMSSRSAGSGRSRATSNPSRLELPRSTMSEFAKFTSPATRTRELSTDLLSFSPVQAQAPIDPFFGIDDDTSTPAIDNDEPLTKTATPPMCTTSSSTPTSSFASIHKDAKTLRISTSTPGSMEVRAVPHASFTERTTRSFGSLSSSFTSVETTAGQSGALSSFSPFSSAASDAAAPSSTPSSLCGPLRMTNGLLDYAPGANESDEVDPFAEAGLVAPEQIPLAEALVAWSAAEAVVDEVKKKDYVKEKAGEKDAGEMEELAADATNSDAASVIEGKTSSSDALDLTKSAETEATPDDWTIATERDKVFSESKHETGDATVFHSTATVVESDVEDDDDAVDWVSRDSGNDFPVVGTPDNSLDNDIDEDDSVITAKDNVFLPAKQSPADANDGSLDKSQADSLSFGLDQNTKQVPLSDDVGIEMYTTAETTEKESSKQAMNLDGSDDFGELGGATAATLTMTNIANASPWGSFSSSTPVPKVPIDDDDDEFGDFAVSAPMSSVANTAPVDDDFGDFAQSTEPSDNDEFGDFGHFEQSLANNDDAFTDFQQSSVDAFGEHNNGYGGFTSAVSPAPTLSSSALSKTELSGFFKEAFAVKPLPAIWPDQLVSPIKIKSSDSYREQSTDMLQDMFRDMWGEYISIIAAMGSMLSSSSGSFSTTAELNNSSECVRLDRSTKRASKYLKYVLSEKIQEASKQNGIFTHGSERHQMYVEFAASGDADRMCAALKELQDALFHSSVNDATMRIAKQAALSAKAKIAEQAAQQQAISRGGSLFSTTRHLLSRGGSTVGAYGSSSSGADNKSEHAGADTPTGVSVQKSARYPLVNTHDDFEIGQRGANIGEERGSVGSDHTVHSSGSDSEAASNADSRTRSQILSNSGSSNGGLMKKFQDRFSFSGSRHRPRLVSLRRKGQLGEEVRKMELNLDAISGGLDEVKWKCALFLYDVEEVAHVAPSQIRILAYPSRQPLAGKTDRSALTKLVKPDTIWTVDIGVNTSDMLLNE